VIPTYIIIHHSLTKDSGTVSWGAIRHYHKSYACNGTIISEELAKELEADGKPVKRPWLDIGYHVGTELINEDYEILLGRMPSVQGAHCAAAGMNAVSLGICNVGNFDVVKPPHEQWMLCLKVTNYFRNLYSIPVVAVNGHREFDPHKTCPGKLWDMARFREDLESFPY
jgi:hypothetical protein